MDKKAVSMGEKVDFRKSIVASLEYGRVFSRGFIGFIYALCGFFLTAIAFTIFVSFYYAEYEALYTLILFGIGIICLPIVLIYHHELLKKIMPFTADAVELIADSIEIGSYKQTESLVVPTTRKKISVRFIFDGKKIVRESGKRGYTKQYLYNTKAGYEKIFAKYANRKIRILYSPYYDQVLILKDKNVKKV